MDNGEKTVLTKANNQSYSLRTTVPSGIIHNFDLKEGDEIFWKIVPKQNKLSIEVVMRGGNRK